jgi:hypothetical protein
VKVIFYLLPLLHTRSKHHKKILPMQSTGALFISTMKSQARSVASDIVVEMRAYASKYRGSYLSNL